MIDLNLIGAPAFAVRVVGDDFIYADVNPRLTALTGLTRAQMVGFTPEQCMAPETAATIVARYRECVETRQAIDSEACYDLPGGSRWWHVTVTPVFDQNGAVSYLIGVSADITSRMTAERDRRELDARMALALDVLDGGFWHLDIESNHLEISPQLTALVAEAGTRPLTWEDYATFVHPEDVAGIGVAALARGERDDLTVEYRVNNATTGTHWLRCKRRLIRDETNRPHRIIGVVVDITDHKRLQEFYEAQAQTDPLTGLRNRRGFEQSARLMRAEAERSGSGLSLIVLDLDHFKPVNDVFGHGAGDRVLQEIARRLQQQVRPRDVVARLGGDEFAILVEALSDDEMATLAQRLVTSARRPIATNSGELCVGASVGVAALTDDGGIEDALARADRALYEVKRSCRGTWKRAA